MKPTVIAKPDRREEIESALKTAVSENWQIAVVILNNVSSQTYECVKQWGNQRLGLATQCVSFQALEANRNNLRMCKDFLVIDKLRLDRMSFRCTKSQSEDQCKNRRNQWSCEFESSTQSFVERRFIYVFWC